MADVLTEGTNLAVAPEVSLGTQPTTGWVNLQPNSYGDVGSSIKKVARTPISKNRQNQQGILVDLDSAAPWQADITKDLIDLFMGGIFMSAVKHSGGTGQSKYEPTAVVDGGGAADSFSVPTNGALPQNTLIYVRGWANLANNGVFVVAAGSDADSINVPTASLVAESPVPTGVTPTIDVIGVQASVAADIQMDGSGNLISTALDWTTKGLNVGQWIFIPPASHGASFSFANLAYYGFAMIEKIEATKLTLKNRQWTVGAADNAAGKTIRVFFTKWCRNVALDHADALKPSFQFEITYPDLGGAAVPEYEYAAGCLVDEWAMNVPLTDKATVDLGFIGTNTADPSTTRATGGSSAKNPLTQIAVSSATDVPRLRIQNADETGITTDFKSLKITFKNNVTPEKTVGTLGATRMNLGRFEVMVDADVLFTSSQVVKAVRDNRTVSLVAALRNGDFACLVHVPSMTVMNTDRNFPTNQMVQLKTQASGFQDGLLGYTASMSVFGWLPATS